MYTYHMTTIQKHIALLSHDIQCKNPNTVIEEKFKHLINHKDLAFHLSCPNIRGSTPRTLDLFLLARLSSRILTFSFDFQSFCFHHKLKQCLTDFRDCLYTLLLQSGPHSSVTKAHLFLLFVPLAHNSFCHISYFPGTQRHKIYAFILSVPSVGEGGETFFSIGNIIQWGKERIDLNVILCQKATQKYSEMKWLHLLSRWTSKQDDWASIHTWIKTVITGDAVQHGRLEETAKER